MGEDMADTSTQCPEKCSSVITIFKGEDSDFANLNDITINIKTDLDLSGYTGEFCFLGVRRVFTEEEFQTKKLNLVFTAEETKGFCLGQNYGIFYIYDTEGNKATLCKVILDVVSARPCDCRREIANEVSVCINQVYKFDKLDGIPTINGVKLQGDKKGVDYGLQRIPHYSATDTYKVGQQVIYNNEFWECKEAITEGEDFDSSKWIHISRVDMAKYLIALSRRTYNIAYEGEYAEKVKITYLDGLFYEFISPEQGTITRSKIVSEGTVVSPNVYQISVGLWEIVYDAINETLAGNLYSQNDFLATPTECTSSSGEVTVDDGYLANFSECFDASVEGLRVSVSNISKSLAQLTNTVVDLQKEVKNYPKYVYNKDGKRYKIDMYDDGDGETGFFIEPAYTNN